MRGITVGVDRRYNEDGIDGEVTAAVRAAEDVLTAMGAGIREVAFPLTNALLRDWIPFCAVERAGHAFQQRTDWHARRPPEP